MSPIDGATLKHVIRRLHPLSPTPHSLDALGFGASVAEGIVQRVMHNPSPTGWAPTGFTQNDYLDLMEPLVRAAATWQNDEGAIIDPVEQIEHGQTSPRYVAPGAILLAAGRIPDLAESLYRTMDRCCARLADGLAKSPDFWMRELMTAYFCLEPIASPERLTRWKADLYRVDPERVYNCVSPDGSGLDTLHNWTVYAAAGEYLRAHAGFAPEQEVVCGRRFFEKYMPAQRMHFTAEGMYRDPNDPLTYDFTTRLQIATALTFGYDGPLQADYQELLRRGGLATLLYMSPGGYAPYGGRSSQFNFQEAIISALCELEAIRYRDTDTTLAGAFARQAHLSAQATRRWLLEMHPHRHLKNAFQPAERFGIDDYGIYSVYSLFAASCFGLAALFMDETIPEAPCPTERGGYIYALPGAFHKIFACAGQTGIEIDTQADPHYDATGLGRVIVADAPMELVLGMPITATPTYQLPENVVADTSLAITPAWRTGDTWTRLAEDSTGVETKVLIPDETADTVSFVVHYRLSDETVVDAAHRVAAGEVSLTAGVICHGEPAEAVRLLIPLLASDGEAESTITTNPGRVLLNYRGTSLTISFDPLLHMEIDATLVANRNGLYRTLILESPNAAVTATLTVGK